MFMHVCHITKSYCWLVLSTQCHNAHQLVAGVLTIATYNKLRPLKRIHKLENPKPLENPPNNVTVSTEQRPASTNHNQGMT